MPEITASISTERFNAEFNSVLESIIMDYSKFYDTMLPNFLNQEASKENNVQAFVERFHQDAKFFMQNQELVKQFVNTPKEEQKETLAEFIAIVSKLSFLLTALGNKIGSQKTDLEKAMLMLIKSANLKDKLIVYMSPRLTFDMKPTKATFSPEMKLLIDQIPMSLKYALNTNNRQQHNSGEVSKLFFPVAAKPNASTNDKKNAPSSIVDLSSVPADYRSFLVSSGENDNSLKIATFKDLIAFQSRLSKIIVYFEKVNTQLFEDLSRRSGGEPSTKKTLPNSNFQNSDFEILAAYFAAIFTAFFKRFNEKKEMYLTFTSQFLMQQFSISFQKVFFIIWVADRAKYTDSFPKSVRDTFNELKSRIIHFFGIAESKLQLQSLAKNFEKSPVYADAMHIDLHFYLPALEPAQALARMNAFTSAIEYTALEKIHNAIRKTSPNPPSNLYFPYNIENYDAFFAELVKTNLMNSRRSKTEHANFDLVLNDVKLTKNYSLTTVSYQDSDNEEPQDKILLGCSGSLLDEPKKQFNALINKLAQNTKEAAYVNMLNRYNAEHFYRFAFILYNLALFEKHANNPQFLLPTFYAFLQDFQKLCSERSLLLDLFDLAVTQQKKNLQVKSTINFSVEKFYITDLISYFIQKKTAAGGNIEKVVNDMNVKFLALPDKEELGNYDKLAIVNPDQNTITYSKESVGRYIARLAESVDLSQENIHPNEEYVIIIRRVCDVCENLRKPSLKLIHALESYSRVSEEPELSTQELMQQSQNALDDVSGIIAQRILENTNKVRDACTLSCTGHIIKQQVSTSGL